MQVVKRKERSLQFDSRKSSLNENSLQQHPFQSKGASLNGSGCPSEAFLSRNFADHSPQVSAGVGKSGGGNEKFKIFFGKVRRS